MWHRRQPTASPPPAAFTHLVFAATSGSPRLDETARALVERSLRATCEQVGVTVHAVGVMPNHVHLAVSIPARVEPGALVDQVKTASADLINRGEDDLPEPPFSWRDSYGALVTGDKPREDVVADVVNQAAPHASRDFLPPLENVDAPLPPPAPR